MAGQTVILRSQRQREIAHTLIDAAPDDFIVNVKEPTRNNEQNSRMWAMLSDIARAKPEDRHWTAETWKCAMMHGLGWQCQFADPLDGQGGPFPIGFKSSRLSVREMAMLITAIQEYGDRHGIEWSEPNPYDREDAA